MPAGAYGSFALILGGGLFDFDEEARLFEKLEGQEWVQRIVTMALNTGMRSSISPGSRDSLSQQIDSKLVWRKA